LTPATKKYGSGTTVSTTASSSTVSSVLFESSPSIGSTCSSVEPSIDSIWLASVSSRFCCSSSSAAASSDAPLDSTFALSEK